MNHQVRAIEKRIMDAIPDARVEVKDTRGDGYHYEVHVRSSSFEGLSRVKQHQRVYHAIGDDVGHAIHALSVHTHTN